MIKTFYRTSCDYSVNLDTPKLICRNRIADSRSGEEDSFLQEAERRFYESLIGLIGDNVEYGATENEHFDILYQDCWYADPEHTQELAKFSVSENAIIRYLLSERNGTDHVIGGERCSTRTAMLIGEWVEEWRWEDVFRTRERLYRKRTGHFFLETAYQKHCNCPLWDKTEYRWLTVEEARAWVKDHAEDAFDELFGEVHENSESTMISAFIRKDTREMLGRIKATSGKTTGEVLDEAIGNLYRAAPLG